VTTTSRLLVFAKAPRPGGVKTRLGAALGTDLAADLYRAMAEGVLARTRAAPCVRSVFFAPREAEAEMAAWLPHETLVPQDGADLGARMAAAFAWAFSVGATKVVLVGTDAPGLSDEHVRAALVVLDAHDVVLGPALDGGYYLVALRRPAPALFDGVAWGTADVLAQTVARAEAAGLAVAPLAPLGDVDELADLRREWPALRQRIPDTLVRALVRAHPDLEPD
jgi:uncharacterized protein